MENKKDKITEVSEKKEDAAVQESCCCQCSHKTKERSEKEYQRPDEPPEDGSRVRCVESRECWRRMLTVSDILVQVAAVNAALNSFNKVTAGQSHLRPVWRRISGRAMMRSFEELVRCVARN